MPKAIVIGQGEEARVAPPDLPIGFKVNCAIAVAPLPRTKPLAFGIISFKIHWLLGRHLGPQ